MANPRWTESSVPRSLPERIAQLYYTLGVFCASRPFIILIFTIFCILTCSYPVIYLPLPGNVPQSHRGNDSVSVDSPRWFHSSRPYCYIQQVVMKTAVSPWSDNLLLTDAYRAPLAEVFNLLEVIRNYQHPNSSLCLSDLCLHVESVKNKVQEKQILPEFSCLLLSPANFWQQDVHRYLSDVNLISTVYNFQNLQKGKVSLTEILFGLNLKHTGIKRYPLRKRQRVIQFAVTIFLQSYDQQFIDGLKDHLAHLYPLHQPITSSDPNKNSSEYISDSVLHVYYPSEFGYQELGPLVFTYVLLFFYVYFSVRKIELVRSKVGIAAGAVLTVFFSSTMTFGLCFFFGLELSVNSIGREVFPYLEVMVGLENIFVLTKSVVSTAPHLDLKIRIAQGLSREGWSITKNLLTEVTILTIGLVTLVPAIQIFCIFAIVGLLTDFFLQMLFFTTILSLDIRQADNISEPAQSFLHLRYNPIRNTELSRSRSHPRLNSAIGHPKIPKRLKLVNFWATTRIFQRAFMVGMVVWIGGIVYSAGVLERFVSVNENDLSLSTESSTNPSVNLYRSPLTGEINRRAAMMDMEEKLLASQRHTLKQVKDDSDLLRLRHSNYDLWRRLSPHHWSTALSLYNNTLFSGSYITLLPSIHIASPVSPDRAIALRNPFEKQMPKFQWHSLALALDPLDLSDSDLSISKVLPSTKLLKESPFLPSSPMELFLSALLVVVSTVVLAYCVVVLYRCICSRNYAEWRASWAPEKDSVDNSTQVLLEAVPLVLESHPQEVECLVSDGNIIVSSCLAGEVRCWDATTGELNIIIKRESLPNESNDDMLYHELSSLCESNKANDNVRSRYKPSDKTKYWDFSDANPTIHTNYNSNNIKTYNTSNQELKNGLDYGPDSNKMYNEYLKTKGRNKIENGDCESIGHEDFSEYERQKSDCLSNDDEESGEDEANSVESEHDFGRTVSPIWCLDCQEGLIVIGCANGKMEFWNSSTGKLKYVTDEMVGVGLTCVRLVGSYVVAARLNGTLDIFNLSWRSNEKTYRRSHIRTGSAGSPIDWSPNDANGDERLSCIKISSNRAHQQPITVLDVEGGRIVTGSQDHTLKVIGLTDQTVVYTLHGHCGPITALFIDRFTPTTAGSGSQDGMLCLWDLLTGACMYSVQAHDGFVMALSYSASYIISLGADERLCVWERFQGHLLNTIHVSQTYCTSIVMLTHNLLITSKLGSLVVWDVRTGEPVRVIKLGLSDSCLFVQNIVPLRNSIACDYGRQLRIVRFPLVRDKTE